MAVERKKFAIIDGKSVFYRGYYAMGGLSTKDGTPTGGVFGFATMALEVIRRLKPDYVCVAWDKPKTNIRKRLELYPEYKAGRKPSPPDFAVQIPLLHELLEAFGWPLYELDDYEADDIMGTLAVAAAKKDIETMLITSDLDMLQLVDPHIRVYAMKKGFSNIELYSPDSFKAKYGIDATQFLDLKALKGDSSDNIPGVPGIGEKTAIELLKEHKTLDNVYKNVDIIPEKYAKKLKAGKDLAYLSKKLAQIWTDAPIKLNLKEIDGSTCNPKKVQEVLERLEFRTLARQLPEVMQVPVSEQSHKSYDARSDGKNTVIDTEESLAQLDLSGAKELVIHSRSAGEHGQKPVALILSSESGKTYTLVLDKLSPEAVSKALKTVIENPKVAKIGFDLKATIKALFSLGINLQGIEHDVADADFLLDSLKRDQNLTELAQVELSYEGQSLEDLSNEEYIERANLITNLIRKLTKVQITKLAKLPKVAKLAKEIEWPIILVLARMEYEGIELNTKYLEKFSDELKDSVSDLEQKIYGHANQEFNISSPGQLADVLFTNLNLPSKGIKKGKTGFSTAASELDKLRGIHPIINLITEYREVTKLMNTYVETLPKMVDENSRLHTTYNLNGSQTGRLSSTDPNLQNIPIRTDLGKHIRTAFVAGPDKALISADYNQFELRIAAYLSNDKDLIDLFNRDVDVHTATAAEIYGREPEDITKNMRRDAKVVNFGVMYGLGAHGLTVATGMTFEAAKNFIDKYFEVRPKLLKYIDSVKEMANKEGYVENIFGRRRPTPDVKSSNFMVREAAMRAAVNMPFQGSAADIMKKAMIDVDKKLAGTDCKMLLQIHDSVLIECPTAEAEKTAKLIKKTMEDAVKLPVKLTVDTSAGKNWGEL